MPRTICEDCGSLVEAEVTHNGVCAVGHYVHCGWGHELSLDDLISDDAAKIIADLEAQAAEIERLETYRKKTYEGLLKVTRIHDEVEAKLENLLGGAETVLEAWDSGDEASFREAIEEMRADVEAAKGSKDE